MCSIFAVQSIWANGWGRSGAGGEVRAGSLGAYGASRGSGAECDVPSKGV